MTVLGEVGTTYVEHVPWFTVLLEINMPSVVHADHEETYQVRAPVLPCCLEGALRLEAQGSFYGMPAAPFFPHGSIIVLYKTDKLKRVELPPSCARALLQRPLGDLGEATLLMSAGVHEPELQVHLWLGAVLHTPGVLPLSVLMRLLFRDAPQQEQENVQENAQRLLDNFRTQTENYFRCSSAILPCVRPDFGALVKNPFTEEAAAAVADLQPATLEAIQVGLDALFGAQAPTAMQQLYVLSHVAARAVLATWCAIRPHPGHSMPYPSPCYHDIAAWVLTICVRQGLLDRVPQVLLKTLAQHHPTQWHPVINRLLDKHIKKRFVLPLRDATPAALLGWTIGHIVEQHLRGRLAHQNRPQTGAKGHTNAAQGHRTAPTRFGYASVSDIGGLRSRSYILEKLCQSSPTRMVRTVPLRTDMGIRDLGQPHVAYTDALTLTSWSFTPNHCSWFQAWLGKHGAEWFQPLGSADLITAAEVNLQLILLEGIPIGKFCQRESLDKNPVSWGCVACQLYTTVIQFIRTHKPSCDLSDAMFLASLGCRVEPVVNALNILPTPSRHVRCYGVLSKDSTRWIHDPATFKAHMTCSDTPPIFHALVTQGSLLMLDSQSVDVLLQDGDNVCLLSGGSTTETRTTEGKAHTLTLLELLPRDTQGQFVDGHEQTRYCDLSVKTSLLQAEPLA
jgi:hypothetical protein